VFLCEILCGCICWLIIEVILRNARCNNKVYIFSFIFMGQSACSNMTINDRKLVILRTVGD